MSAIEWNEGSGLLYTIVPIGQPLPQRSGNYVFCKRVLGYWFPIYAGEAGHLNARVNGSHEKAACINQNGATHVSYRLHDGDERARRAEESDIRNLHSPVCNG